MVRWYDYLVAFLAADFLMTVAFSIPWVGFVVAYGAYEYGWPAYCQYRLSMERK